MAGCVGSSSQGDSNTKSVGMTDDLKFDPGTVHVSVGTTVVWKNTTDASHTVTAYEAKLPTTLRTSPAAERTPSKQHGRTSTVG
ncbi:cupredoxin domain-containing protein [Halococcus thailandensis]|uniref:cupredoxin domain-containing protein n=1 Tax=Halococcus thailandensis TaxID=335952 RepID=UPI0026D04F49